MAFWGRLQAGIQAFANPEALAKVTTERTVGPPALEAISEAARSYIRASYDTVSRTPENTRHWQWIDYLSADATLTPEVRKEIRAQARYEVQQNNGYGVGIASTLVNDTIGSGPRLQMLTPNETVNKEVEQAFLYWSQAIGLREKLTTMRMSKLIDGEVVGRKVNNLLSGDPVTIDLLTIECDQLTTPDNRPPNKNYIDGVHIDRFGYPYAYDILNEHPGSNNNLWVAQQNSYQTYGYQQVIHYFRKDRPGQHRGISELAPSLPLFALLRRFTLATVTAAETAASVAQIVETDAPIPEELEREYAVNTFGKFWESVPINRNSATVLPNQWKLKQFASEHPTTTYRMFKQELINEIARVINMPRNIACGDSSDSNYASARLDHLGYQKTVHIEQSIIEHEILDRLFAEWLVEAALMGVLSKRLANYVLQYEREYGMRGLASRVEHSWYWDGFEDADQKADADAQRVRLMSGTTHRAAEYAKAGKDVDIEDQRAARTWGMSVAEYRRVLASSLFSNGNQMSESGSGSGSGSSESSEGEDSEETQESETAASFA